MKKPRKRIIRQLIRHRMDELGVPVGCRSLPSVMLEHGFVFVLVEIVKDGQVERRCTAVSPGAKLAVVHQFLLDIKGE